MRKRIFSLLVGFFFVSIMINFAPSLFADETLTITTYYPSPFGSYNELQLAPHDPAGVTCDDAHKGTMYYKSADNQVYVCKGATLGWQTLGGSNAGSAFTRWGSGSAPAAATLLYSGWGFSAYYNHYGGSHPMCMQGGDPGSAGDGNYGDLIYPMSTGDATRMPPGITAYKHIRCARAYAVGPTFELWGSQTCPSGWTHLYQGYSMGEYYGHIAGKGIPICVDSNAFDTSVDWSHSAGGSFITRTLLGATSNATSYPSLRLVKCAVCVKQ